METKDTSKLENAYSKFGNIAHVKHWYKADCFTAPMLKNADNKGVLKKFGPPVKPFFWLPVVKVPFRPMERLDMGKGFNYPYGFALCNGKPIEAPCKTVMDVERIARKMIKKDWQIWFISAFQDLTYQRQGRNKWVLVEIGKGYA